MKMFLSMFEFFCWKNIIKKSVFNVLAKLTILLAVTVPSVYSFLEKNIGKKAINKISGKLTKDDQSTNILQAVFFCYKSVLNSFYLITLV